ncbi:MAG: hypothetical protein ACRDUX_25210 [Mycobacterium sp.]
MTRSPDVVILADHSALLAIPAFAPAILVVAVVIWVARRDRRLGDDGDDVGDDKAHSEHPASGDEDGSP